jgi:hypothetical protein
MNLLGRIKKQTLIFIGLSLLPSLTIAANEFAPQYGFIKPAYFSALFGYSEVNYTNDILRNGIRATKILNGGTAVKVSLGYDFARYFGGEFGVIYFQKPRFRGVSGLSELGLPDTVIVKNNVVYLAGKFNLFFTKHFFATAKAGIGYVARSGIAVNGVVGLKESEIVRPVYGAGIGWLLTPHWALEANWLQAAASRGDQLPTSNFYGVGFQYRFSL